MRLAVVVVVLASAALVSCTSRPSRVEHAPKVAPDEEYEVGSTWADRFLVWRCYEGQRVTMIQPCSPHSCSDWRVSRGACGTPTAGEAAARTSANARDAGVSIAMDGTVDAGAAASEEYARHPIPNGSGWR